MPAPISTTKGACFTPRSRSSLVARGQPPDHRLLHHVGEVARLVDLVVERDRPHDLRQAVHRLAGRRVLARGDRFGLGVRREVEEVGLDAARLAGCGWRWRGSTGTDRRRSRLAIAVRSSSGMNTSVPRVSITSMPGCFSSRSRSRSVTSSTSSASLMPLRARARDRGRRGRRRSRCATRRARAAAPAKTAPFEFAVGDGRRHRARRRRPDATAAAPAPSPRAIAVSARPAAATARLALAIQARPAVTAASRSGAAGFAADRRALEVDDQAVRVVEGEHAVGVDRLHVHHDPRRVLRMPAEPDLADDVVVELEDSVLQRRRRPRALQIEEHAPRVVEPLLAEASTRRPSRC